MSERETMQEMMERERAEAIRSMERANRAMSRIFNLEEKEGENE
jgi:bacterioferritin (cytochrome b1)